MVNPQTLQTGPILPSQYPYLHLPHEIVPSIRPLKKLYPRFHLELYMMVSARAFSSGIKRLILANHQQDHDFPFITIDSLLHEMETGEEATDLHVPHEYRESMVSLSDQSLIPTPVSPRKRPGSAAVKIGEGRGVAENPDTGAAKSTIPSSSPKRDHIARHNRQPSYFSKHSSSVYSDSSSASTSAKTRYHESSYSYESTARSSNPKSNSVDDTLPEHAKAADIQDLKPSIVALAPQPLQLSERTKSSLEGNSVAHQSKTFLLDSSSSEFKPSTPSSGQQSSRVDRAGKEKLYETGSEYASSGSSESVEEPNKVRPLLAS